MKPTPQQIHILRHSLGLDDNGHGNQYRNYFCTGLDCDSYTDCSQLEQMGMMSDAAESGKNIFFTVTELGRAEALKGVVYPKLTRSQRRIQAFRKADSGLTFREWLNTKFGKMDY